VIDDRTKCCVLETQFASQCCFRHSRLADEVAAVSRQPANFSGRFQTWAVEAAIASTILGFFLACQRGGDLYILSRVVDSFEDTKAVAVLANCRQAMGARGRLLLVEPVLPDRIGTEAPQTVQEEMLMDLTMLLRTGGQERTEAEYRAFLAEAGLRLERIVPTAAAVSLVEAALA